MLLSSIALISYKTNSNNHLMCKYFQKAYSAIQAVEEQFRTLQTESKQLEQEVVKEKTVVLQITAEKGEIEQHLEVSFLEF